MVSFGTMAWVALALTFLAAGLTFGNLALLTGAIFLLLMVLLASYPQAPYGIRVERSLPRAICWAGDTMQVERRVTATSGIGILFIHDSLPQELDLIEGNNLRAVWKWPGEKTYDLPYTVTFAKRGDMTLPPTTWTSQAPFGIRKSGETSVGEPLAVSVAPRIRGVTRLNEVRVATVQTRYQDDLSVAGVSHSEFRQLRPYAPGDPIKLINWKASSRGSRYDNLPLVNELEPEARRAVWIFLDIANYMDVGTPLANPLENTIEAAGSLAQFYLSKGSTIGAYAYNNYGTGGELLSPDSGQKQFKRLTQMLAGLKAGPPRQDLMQSVEWCKDFLLRLQPEVFIMTRLDVFYARPGEDTSPQERLISAVKRLTALRRRSRRPGMVRVIHVSPRESRLHADRPFEGAGLGQWESAALASDLRRSGAHVIDWEPSHEDFISALVRHMHAYR